MCHARGDDLASGWLGDCGVGLSLIGCREIDAALFVHALSGAEVEIGKRDLPRPLIRKNPKRTTEYGVVLHFHLMAVAVHEEGRGRFFFGRRGRLG